LWLKIGPRGIFAINFFYEASEAKIKTHLTRNLDEPRERILYLGSLYFQRYDLSKLGFLQAPEFHVKQVMLGKVA